MQVSGDLGYGSLIIECNSLSSFKRAGLCVYLAATFSLCRIHVGLCCHVFFMPDPCMLPRFLYAGSMYVAMFSLCRIHVCCHVFFMPDPCRPMLPCFLYAGSMYVAMFSLCRIHVGICCHVFFMPDPCRPMLPCFLYAGSMYVAHFATISLINF